MKKNTTIKELEKEYGSKKILDQIEEAYKQKYDKLYSIIAHKNSPIHRYSTPMQISFLDNIENDSDSIIYDLIETLRDAVYFFTLSKKERTKTIQNLRAYEIQYLKQIINRLSFFISDPTLFINPSWNKKPKKNRPNSLEKTYQFCESLMKVLLDEESYLNKLSKTSYLTAFQVTMSDFFVFMKKIGMSQKDQITLVKNIFDKFKVDWDEGDRENIRVSLQQPALAHSNYRDSEIQSILIERRLKNISSEMGSQIKELAIEYRKFLRRF
tara:strand:- start:269 stop:1075 length:807 start_codon:yes stop_codon:yes gene_type:complete